jgi:hypothetical protein
MRRILVTACAVALGTAGLVAAGATSASAGKPVVTAVGSVTCGAPGSGKAKINPPFKLTPGVGPRVTTSKFKTTCTGTTGNPAVTPISAKITATSTSPNSDTLCTELTQAAETPTVTTVFIKWKGAGGKINPTNITFTTLNGGTPAGGFTSPGPSGVSIVTGSYEGNDAVSVVLVDPSTVTALTNSCLNPKKGIKKLAFSSGGSLNITP